MRISYDVSVGGEKLGRVCVLFAGEAAEDPESSVLEAYTILWGPVPEKHHGLAERLLFETRAHVVYGGDVLRAVRRPGIGDVARVHNIVRG